MEDVILRQWRAGPLQNFVYLLAHEDGRGLLVDPAFATEQILREVEAMGVRVTDILITHGHHDHIEGLPLAKKRTGARVLAHTSADYEEVDARLEDGQRVEVAGLDVRAVHTPGHRFDSLCYVVEGTYILTGDTLFVGECGRVDLPGSDVRAMWTSLVTTLRGLPDELVVCPGHDYGPKPLSTLGEEKRMNYTMRERTLEEFMAFMAEP